MLNNEVLVDRYVVIAAQGSALGFVTNPNIEILRMPGLCSWTLAAPIIYRFVLGRVLDRVGADVVLNIGDLIIHTTVKQIYVFDWAYALDVHPKVWADMKSIDLLIRKAKLWLLKRYFHRPDIVIAQTHFIQNRLKELYSLKDVRVINNAVTIKTAKKGLSPNFDLPPGVRLVCPAVYYPHKNIEVLLDLASLIMHQNLDYRIVTTVNPDTGAAQRFVDAIVERRLQYVIKNIGQVPLDQMYILYEQCDALLMPTLLESFSIVYLESMHHGLPIFTSNMWFARSVCGEAAKYFDPFNAEDILRSLNEVMPNADAKEALVAVGRRQLASFPTWEENFAAYCEFINELS